MDVRTSLLDGFTLYQGSPIYDSRGFFLEWINEKLLTSFSEDFALAQANMSVSKLGVVRGMHFSTIPQTKILICANGSIRDFAVDLRLNSPNFGRSECFKLDSQSGGVVVVSPGLAHGFEVLSDEATLIYLTDLKYSPEADYALNIFDQEIGIKLQHRDPIISEKDRAAPNLRELIRDGILDKF